MRCSRLRLGGLGIVAVFVPAICGFVGIVAYFRGLLFAFTTFAAILMSGAATVMVYNSYRKKIINEKEKRVIDIIDKISLFSFYPVGPVVKGSELAYLAAKEYGGRKNGGGEA